MQPSSVHEDLLSTPSSSSSASPSSSSARSSEGRSRQPDYFSRSFLSSLSPPLPPPSTSPLVPLSAPIPSALPPTMLSNGLPNPLIRWRPLASTSLKEDLELYKTLSKARLSALVVLTAMAGYAMGPTEAGVAGEAFEMFANSLSTGSLQSLSALDGPAPTTTNSLTLSVLLPATVGTALCSASAASFNQLIEAPYDAQMARTRSRPVPRRLLSPLHATTFGLISGLTGVGTLAAINPLAASVGLGTILLYFPLYTLAKRHTIYNTWLGAVVGALPPLIGWSACTGSLDPFTQPGAWALFALLYFWQFPHFNSLSHTLRSSYAGSGYRMLAVLDPPRNALVSLRYSLALIPLAFVFPPIGLTTIYFPFLATIPNGVMAFAAWRFYQERGERRAKELFWCSLAHLPIVLGLGMVCRKGLWEETLAEENEVEDDLEEGQAEGKSRST